MAPQPVHPSKLKPYDVSRMGIYEGEGGARPPGYRTRTERLIDWCFRLFGRRPPAQRDA
jgi:hypothetical protein